MAQLKRAITQEELEAYEAEVQKAGIAEMSGTARLRVAAVKAASAAGWFDVALTPAEWSDPAAVVEAWVDVLERYRSLIMLDPTQLSRLTNVGVTGIAGRPAS